MISRVASSFGFASVGYLLIGNLSGSAITMADRAGFFAVGVVFNLIWELSRAVCLRLFKESR